MEVVFEVLKMAWGFFSQIECPFLGISFASLFIGVFVVGFSIRLLRPLLGIGGAAARFGESAIGRKHRENERERKRIAKKEGK